MPIVGLTTNQRPMPVYLGKLRKGDTKPNASKPGADLQYFRFDAGEDAELNQLFESAFGTEANNIPVLLPFQTASENFEAWREHYVKSGLNHRCDGEMVWERNHAGELYRTDKPCPGECKQVGRLSVVIPALAQAGRFGITTVLTSSKWDIATLSQLLSYYEMLAGGNLRGVPFVLSRKPRMVSVTYNNTRSRAEKWLIQIEPAQEWITRRLADAQRLALASSVMALPAPVEHDSAEDDDEDDNLIVDSYTGEILEAPQQPAEDPEKTRAIQAYSQAAMRADEIGLTNRVSLDDAFREGFDVSTSEIVATTKQIATHAKVWERYSQLWQFGLEVGAELYEDDSPESAKGWDFESLKAQAGELDATLKDRITELLPDSKMPAATEKAEVWMNLYRTREEVPF